MNVQRSNSQLNSLLCLKLFEDTHIDDTNHETERCGPYFQAHQTNSLPGLTLQQRSAKSHLGKSEPVKNNSSYKQTTKLIHAHD